MHMQVRVALLATALMLTPPIAWAADLVIWWEEGRTPPEDAAVREIVAAFETKTGHHVDLVLQSGNDLLAKTRAAVEAGNPPDLVQGIDIGMIDFPRWARDGRLADLTDALGPLIAQFDKDALDQGPLLDATSGRRGVYALPMGRISQHVHVWKSLLEQAGFTLADIPKEWEPFWSFWCEKVQPAVRKVTGRNDIYGIGLPMSFLPAGDTDIDFWQFVQGYRADYVTRDGRLVIDEPEVRAKLVSMLDGYTSFYHKGCVPPDATGWDSYGNNDAFLKQRIVMTVNNTLSIPAEIRAHRPDDYYKNTATIEWPSDMQGQPLPIATQLTQAAVIRAGGHEATAKEFVRFLTEGGWLAHWLGFAGDRFLPPLPALLNQPFWLDPADPHRTMSAILFATHPNAYNYAAVSGDWRHQLVVAEGVWPKAIRRIAAEGVSPEQAVDEAIARIKQILSE